MEFSGGGSREIVVRVDPCLTGLAQRGLPTSPRHSEERAGSRGAGYMFSVEIHAGRRRSLKPRFGRVALDHEPALIRVQLQVAASNAPKASEAGLRTTKECQRELLLFSRRNDQTSPCIFV